MEDIERSGASRVMFLDDNIVGDQAYAERLFDALRTTGIQWVGQASVSFVRNERLLEKASASGCRGLFVGLESVSEKKIQRMQKSMKTLEDTAAAIRRITESGILFHASIVFGFDDDDTSIFDQTLRFLMETRIASATFNILTPYPGTEVYDRLKAEGRLFTEDWGNYDHCTPTFVPKLMSVDELLDGYHRVKRTFYGLTSIAAQASGQLAHAPSLPGGQRRPEGRSSARRQGTAWAGIPRQVLSTGGQRLRPRPLDTVAADLRGVCMNVQFKKGVLELCVLVVLCRKDYYGYELVQTISKSVDIAEGTVYPLLRRLTKEGYFTTYIQESAEGPARKYYQITQKGREYQALLLEEWNRFINGVNSLIGTEEVA